MKDFFVQQQRNHTVTLGGVKALLDFTTDKIFVRVAGGTLEVQGQQLVIARFDENEMQISGKIYGVLTHVAS